MTKRELKEHFGTLKNAINVSNKYRNEPVNFRILEGIKMDEHLPEERAAFFVMVMMYESMQIDALSLLPPNKKGGSHE